MENEDDVLTPEESNALLEDGAPDAEAATDTAGVRDVEASFWEQVRTDRIPAFETINAESATGLERVWTRLYKREIVVSAEPPRNVRWREFAEEIADGQCLSLIDFKAQGRRGLVILQPDTVSAMVDIYFGGNGASPRSEQLSELTEMERRQMGRFVDALVGELTLAWSRYGRFEIARATDPFEPDVSPFCAPTERVVVGVFVFAIGEIDHRIEVAVPAAIVEMLKKQQRPALPAARADSGGDWQSRLREDVQDARIELRAVLGGSTVKLADIARAKAGDVIATEPLTRVCVYAGSKPVFEGTLGARGGFHAVKISQPISKRLLGDR